MVAMIFPLILIQPGRSDVPVNIVFQENILFSDLKHSNIQNSSKVTLLKTLQIRKDPARHCTPQTRKIN